VVTRSKQLLRLQIGFTKWSESIETHSGEDDYIYFKRYIRPFNSPQKTACKFLKSASFSNVVFPVQFSNSKSGLPDGAPLPHAQRVASYEIKKPTVAKALAGGVGVAGKNSNQFYYDLKLLYQALTHDRAPGTFL
jgi:hypothetical protein